MDSRLASDGNWAGKEMGMAIDLFFCSQGNCGENHILHAFNFLV